MLISNPLKKLKKSYKKVIDKNVTEMCTIYTFTHMFNQFVLLITFLVHISTVNKL
jgi:hypothetical protein